MTSNSSTAQFPALRALLRVARKQFTTHGYADTTTEDVVRRARVSRGALYHHFKSKRHLFQAVYEDLEQELSATFVTAIEAEPVVSRQLLAGIDAFLDACLEPAAQQIVLLDGPAVLGWELWRELDATHGLAVLTQALENAIAGGTIEPLDTEALAVFLLGAVNEAALAIARAKDVTVAREQYGTVIHRVVTGLAPKKRTRAS